MKLFTKIASACITATLLATSVTTLSMAKDISGINKTYTSNFRSDSTYNYNNQGWFIGYYQASTQFYNHNARAGTHYNTGNGVKGKAFVKITYIDKYGQPQHEAEDTGRELQSGYIKTPWATLDNSSIIPTKIEFKGEKHLPNKDVITDRMTVNQ